MCYCRREFLTFLTIVHNNVSVLAVSSRVIMISSAVLMQFATKGTMSYNVTAMKAIQVTESTVQRSKIVKMYMTKFPRKMECTKLNPQLGQEHHLMCIVTCQMDGAGR